MIVCPRSSSLSERTNEVGQERDYRVRFVHYRGAGRLWRPPTHHRWVRKRYFNHLSDRLLAGKNRSSATVRAYQTDIHQFITWLHENNMVMLSPTQVERADITEYLSFLSERKLSGVSRARKVAALREYFRYLVDHNQVQVSPMTGIATPKREKHDRTA